MLDTEAVAQGCLSEVKKIGAEVPLELIDALTCLSPSEMWDLYSWWQNTANAKIGAVFGEIVTECVTQQKLLLTNTT